MPRRLFLALILLVAAPVVLLAWVSATSAKTNERAARESLSNLLASQLRDADRRVGLVFSGYAELLENAIFGVSVGKSKGQAVAKGSGSDQRPVGSGWDASDVNRLTQSLRRMRRDIPIVRQGILVGRQGEILFPGSEDMVGEDGREVAAALPGLVDARPFWNAPPKSVRAPLGKGPPSQQGSAGTFDSITVPNQQAASPPELTRSSFLPQLQMRRSSQQDSQQQAEDAAGLSQATNAVNAEPLSELPEGESAVGQAGRYGTAALGDEDVLPRDAASESGGRSAWQQWYLADGAQVVYWRTLPGGFMVGVILERSRWISDLISVLPADPGVGESPRTNEDSLSLQKASDVLQSTPIGSVTLVDEAQRVVYQWGQRPGASKDPLVVTMLSVPLASWQFQLFVDADLLPQANHWPTTLALGAIALLLLVTGAYVLTSVQRQIAQARSRVSFAGQVSHELRTPLTNIRLYTELAESDLESLDEGETRSSLHRRLNVIDHESRRLQRLVSGVLEMIRPSGRPAGVRIQETEVNELLSGVIEQFRPSFAAAGIALELKCDLAGSCGVDPDVVETVLVNLLSNVEKYIPVGGRCQVTAGWEDDSEERRLRLVVDDDGPGIHGNNRGKVFRPFVRLDDSINAPSGTGIGLTIARRAARRHGGELKLLAESELGGAAFELLLPVKVGG